MKHLSILSSTLTVVSYRPISDEPDPQEVILSAYPNARMLTVPSSSKTDPHQIAKKFRDVIGKSKTVVLVPGRAFDKFGTRHGRGGGWYDRFLAEVPVEWTRIGIVSRTRFSTKKLLRQSWDQSVNIILIRDDDGSWDAVAAKNERTPRDTHLPADQSPIVPAATIAKKKPRARS